MKTNKTFAYGSGMDAAVTNIDWSLRSKLRGLKSSRMMILILIIVLGILFPVACKNEPETITVEKDVTVSFPGVVSARGTLDFSPSYEPKDGWGDYFSVSDITYTLKDDAERTFPDGIVNASLYSNGDMPVFTQEFWVYGLKVGEHSLSTAVLSGNFLFGIQPPPLKLTLTKTVTQ
jgi:hypothetical protein